MMNKHEIKNITYSVATEMFQYRSKDRGSSKFSTNLSAFVRPQRIFAAMAKSLKILMPRGGLAILGGGILPTRPLKFGGANE
jgi:hypothetical protein